MTDFSTLAELMVISSALLLFYTAYLAPFDYVIKYVGKDNIRQHGRKSYSGAMCAGAGAANMTWKEGTQVLTPSGHVRTMSYKFRPSLTNTVGNNCSSVHFSLTPLPTTVLASYPGSGNTWARHLIQLITGRSLVLVLTMLCVCVRHLIQQKGTQHFKIM